MATFESTGNSWSDLSNITSFLSQSQKLSWRKVVMSSREVSFYTKRESANKQNLTGT